MGRCVESEGARGYEVDLDVEGEPTRFRIDTGADVTVINGETARGLRGLVIQEQARPLRDAAGRALVCKGFAEVAIRGGVGSVSARVCIIEGAPQNLLGAPEIQSLRLMQRINGVNVEEDYPRLFGQLGQLPDQFVIKLKDGALPYSLAVPRRLPIGLRDATEKELRRMEEMGVIEAVEGHSAWCAGMVVAPKTSGEVRICVDLTELNKSVKRENFPLPRVEDTLALLEGSAVFSKLDANSGFWQIDLEEGSRQFTTFITPFGRFRFRKMPFGISAAPEFFQRQMSKVLQGLEGVVCMMDDMLVFGRDEREHDDRLRRVVERLEGAGMTLNKTKCVFGAREVIFLGHKVSDVGIEADPGKVEAIEHMQPPSNKSELKSFLGMVNYLGRFSGRLAQVEGPLRDLCKKSSDWFWGPAQVSAFEEVKQEICSAPVLAKYSLTSKHRVSADSSSYALGAVLLQGGERGEWQPVAFASRRLTEAERRYAQIEKEALAITWACERFDFYLVGTCFEVETDHKPLVKLLGDSDLANMPLRCQRFRLRLMRYDFTIFHTPGTQMYLADALSRPAGAVQSVEVQRGQRVELHVRVVSRAEHECPDEMLQEVKEAAEDDEVYTQVLREVEEGWHQGARSYKGDIRRYWTQKEHFTIVDGLLMRDNRVVIPRDLREGILERIHSGHLGLRKCRLRANGSVWWPGLNADLAQYIEGCNICRKHSSFQHYPLRTATLPRGPWEEVATDLFEFGSRDYLLVVDYFSRWVEVVEIADKSAETVINKLKGFWARYGVPQVMRSDDGPCYKGVTMTEFMRRYKVKHVKSSPYYPESNGLAERMVGVIKGMWRKEKDKQLALMVYRNTPLDSGKSPAELLFGRPLRTDLPQAPEEVSLSEFKQRDEMLKRAQKEGADRRRRARELPVLERGEVVWVRKNEADAAKRGVVVKERVEPESYDVRVEGKVYRRNRKQLTKVNMERVLEGLSSDEHESEQSEEEEGSEGTEGEQESEGEEEGEREEAEKGGVRRGARRRSKGGFHSDYVYY